MRGQLVIPKVVRESLGLYENKEIILEVENDVLHLRPALGKEILDSWREIARTEGVDVSKKIVYGDKLYEDVFKR